MGKKGAPTEYALRIKQAMDAGTPPVSIKALAGGARVSVQAVGQLLRGETKAFSVDTHAYAARFLGVDAFWLATGEGEMRPAQASDAVQAARNLLAMAATLNPPSDTVNVVAGPFDGRKWSSIQVSSTLSPANNPGRRAEDQTKGKR